MKLKIFRCGNCGRMLFKYAVDGRSEIEVKCPRCKVVTKVKFMNKLK